MKQIDQDADRRVAERLAVAVETVPTRYQVLQVHDSDLQGLYDAGWAYVEPAEVPGYSIISWQSDKPPVVPLSFAKLSATEASHVG